MCKNKKLIYLLAVIIPFLFSSCNDDDNDTDKQWKAANDKAYNDVALGIDTSSIEWKPIIDTPPGVGDGVYYGVVRSGKSTEKPLQTASVRVLYKGSYYDGNLFDAGTSGNNTVSVDTLIAPGNSDVVYLLWKDDKYTTHIWLNSEQRFQEQNFNLGSTFVVNSTVRGFNIALQNMVVGDKWRLCIPYYMGYGSVLYQGIKGYSTLFFEVELLEINQYPGS
ncbi:MAG: FKBP-type peptidyl-prolyl cis-trans isomerase [Bacteroidales bacterium]|nr:FKBP-type peptidyl-prolyl cis-trans isomerase [Bacteroidales bacterium]